MIALMIMGAIAIYIAVLIIALWLIPKVVEHKYIRRIIFIVWFLIPTWDVIIGYPIYKFLCATQAGVKVYKTVDNVEGFYVGEQRKEYEPIKPYEGYKYVDYKEIDFFKPTGKKYGTYWTGKYYRSYWVDNNTSELCVHYGERKFGAYADAYRSGKCIVKEEIDEGDVSELWLEKRKVEHYKFFYFNVYSVEITIENRKNHQAYFTVQDYFVDSSWTNVSFSSAHKHQNNCFTGKVLNTTSGFTLSDKFVLETLKTKKEER